MAKGFYKFLKRLIEGKKNSKQSTQINGPAKKVAVKKQRTTVIKPVDAAKPNVSMSKNPEVEVEVEVDVDAQVAEQKAKSVPAKVVPVKLVQHKSQFLRGASVQPTQPSATDDMGNAGSKRDLRKLPNKNL